MKLKRTNLIYRWSTESELVAGHRLEAGLPEVVIRLHADLALLGLKLEARRNHDAVGQLTGLQTDRFGGLSA